VSLIRNTLFAHLMALEGDLRAMFRQFMPGQESLCPRSVIEHASGGRQPRGR